LMRKHKRGFSRTYTPNVFQLRSFLNASYEESLWEPSHDVPLGNDGTIRRVFQESSEFCDDLARTQSSFLEHPAVREAEPQQETPTTAVACESNDLNALRVERKRLRDEYRAECKRSGEHTTHEIIAKGSDKRWKSRTQVDKWLDCDPRYDGEADRKIRGFLHREIRRLRDARPKNPNR
jgi:hypothetical protein